MSEMEYESPDQGQGIAQDTAHVQVEATEHEAPYVAETRGKDLGGELWDRYQENQSRSQEHDLSR